jgi:hypothetical protein
MIAVVLQHTSASPTFLTHKFMIIPARIPIAPNALQFANSLFTTFLTTTWLVVSDTGPIAVSLPTDDTVEPMVPIARYILLAVACFSIAACGDEDVLDKNMSDLSSDDDAERCAAIADYKPESTITAFWRWDCTSKQQHSGAACDNAKIDACVTAVPATTCTALATDNCDITLRQWYVCLKTYYDQFLQFSAASCATDTSISLIKPASTFDACAVVISKCPALSPNF